DGTVVAAAGLPDADVHPPAPTSAAAGPAAVGGTHRHRRDGRGRVLVDDGRRHFVCGWSCSSRRRGVLRLSGDAGGSCGAVQLVGAADVVRDHADVFQIGARSSGAMARGRRGARGGLIDSAKAHGSAVGRIFTVGPTAEPWALVARGSVGPIIWRACVLNLLRA